MFRTRLILMSLWLGTAVFFSFVIAPATFGTLHAFAVANANEIAGTIVTHALSIINVSGFVISLLLFCVSLIVKKNTPQLTFRVSSVMLVVMAAATSIGHWVIAARHLRRFPSSRQSGSSRWGRCSAPWR